jgi:hypothetical protein
MAADCRNVRKVRSGRSIAVPPRPERYPNRIFGAEPAA